MPSKTDFNVSPYFDDYSEDKKFHRVMYRPAFAVQARELTTQQSITQNQIEKFGDHMFKHGAMVVPGSTLVKNQAEEEGLDKIFIEAGFDWREAGCSMCLGMNPDILNPGERCASTSNRNYEGRQGAGGRTHLVSPKMAAAAALHGKFVDIRDL